MEEGQPRPSRKIAQVRSARSVLCRVLMLDNTVYEKSVDKRAVGLILFDEICDSVDLMEKDYFGLSFTDPSTGLKSWVNNDKKLWKQIKSGKWEFTFGVKFYPPDPQQLHEDITRYQLCLQIRRDIVEERLPCSFVTYTLLGSYTVQSELGDYDVEEYGRGIDYIKKIQFAPHQDKELLKKIADLHKTHHAQTPEEAELHFLENSKKLSMYGVELHDAKDAEGVVIQLGVSAAGLLVFKEKLQINKFVWPKVIKMSYRRRKFYIKLRPGEFEDFQSQVEFKLQSIRHAKLLWKICVEHHSFFRFREIEQPKSKSGFPRFGSRFRYSGRTQFQTRMAMNSVDRPSPYFDRIHSKRATYHGRPTTRERQREDLRNEERRDLPARTPRREEKEEKRPPPESDHEDDRCSDRHSDRHSDQEEDPADRKSRMEKIHAVPTPIAAVMTNRNKQHRENNVHEQHRENEEDSDSLPDKPPLNDSMDENIDDQLDGIPPPAPEDRMDPSTIKVYSKEEKKRMEKEERERQKRRRAEEKQRKKEEEKERKRIEKERKQSLRGSKKDKGKSKEKQFAEAVAASGEVIVQDHDNHDRSRGRLSSFEDPKDDSQETEEPPALPASLPPPPPPPPGAEDDGSDDDSRRAEGEGSDQEDEERGQPKDSRVGQEFDL